MMFVSACMMVKNGGELFKRALASLAGLVDELVVINTDELAETEDVEAAKEFSDHAHVVIRHRPWQDDFSLHRNQSLEAASGKWLLVLDADEELAFTKGQDAGSLRRWLMSLPDDLNAVFLTLEDINRKGGKDMECLTPRIFKRGSVKYEGRVHNRPRFGDKGIHAEQAVIRHYGYDLDPDTMAAKRARTERLLAKQMEEDPDYAESYFYMAQCLGQQGREEEAIRFGEKYLRKTDQPQETIFYSLGQMYLRRQDHKRALELAMAGARTNPDNPDAASLMAEIGNATGQHQLCIEGCRRYLAAFDLHRQNPLAMGNRFCFTLNENRLVQHLTMLVLACGAETGHAWHTLRPFLRNRPALGRHIRKCFDATPLKEMADFQPAALEKPRLAGVQADNALERDREKVAAANV